MKETRSVRFLYHTAFGRFILKLLTRPFVSRIAGFFLDSFISRPYIKKFIRENGIDMSLYEDRKYKSFNDFFKRRKVSLEVERDDGKLLSPCDGHLSIYKIEENSTFEIKNASYTLPRLLNSEAEAERFRGGYCLVFRLTPLNYHRYSWACSGRFDRSERIEGRLHCVRPIAYTELPVFCENSREVAYIENDALGRVAQMEVGALLVGKIKNHSVKENVLQGDEKGYFEFGGSTVILLVEKDRLEIKGELEQTLNTAVETDVVLGDAIGDCIKVKV